VENAAANLVPLQHDSHSLFLVDGRLPLAAALGVVGQSGFELVCQAEVVHHQAARLVFEHTVHPRDGLHQPVAAHRLVHIHRVQAGRVKARQPHIANDHDFERVFRVLETLRQFLATLLVSDMGLPIDRIGGRTRHHDL